MRGAQRSTERVASKAESAQSERRRDRDIEVSWGPGSKRADAAKENPGNNAKQHDEYDA